jgi:outer membrane protein OmpA-like peptidoglycan-associated protein
LDTVSLRRPPEDTSINLRDPRPAPEPLADISLEKPAAPMPDALSRPVEPIALRPQTEPEPTPAPLALARPPQPQPLALTPPQPAPPAPIAPVAPVAPDVVDIPEQIVAIAMPDTATGGGELAPTGTLPQPSWSPEDVSFPLAIGHIGFDGDSILMNSFYRNTLDDIADKLAGKPRMMLEVRGYAPYDKGTEGRKRALARAVAVRNYLIAAGLPAGQIETYASLSDDADMLKANRVDVLRAR